MATTNLISKSLGDVLTESGNGTPDHTSPLGSLYSDKDTGVVWRNIDSGTSWEKLSTVAYGHGYYNDNTTSTTISQANTWFPVGNNFTEGLSVGFSASTDTLVVEPGYGGDYEIRADVTIDYTTASGNYEVGVSINQNDPTDGCFNGAYLTTTYIKSCISIICPTKTLSAGDTISLDIQNRTGAVNGEVTHAQISVRRV
jgi:hypothetical protein